MMTFVWSNGSRHFTHATGSATNALAFVRWCKANGFGVRELSSNPAPVVRF